MELYRKLEQCVSFLACICCRPPDGCSCLLSEACVLVIQKLCVLFRPASFMRKVRTRNTPSLYAYYVECETLNLLDNTGRKKVNFFRNQASIWNLQIIIILSWHALCRAKTILQERQTLFGASLGFLTCKWFLLLSWHACHKGYPLGTTTQLPAVGWGSVAQGLLWLLCVCVYLWNEAPYCPLRQCGVGRRRGYSFCTSDRLLSRCHVVAVPVNWRALAKAIFREMWPCSNCNIPVIWVIEIVFLDGRIHNNSVT